MGTAARLEQHSKRTYRIRRDRVGANQPRTRFASKVPAETIGAEASRFALGAQRAPFRGRRFGVRRP